MGNFEELAKEYRDLCENEGAQLVLRLSNSIISASEHEKTTISANPTRNKSEFVAGRLRAWMEVNANRDAADSFVHKKLWLIVQNMKKLDAESDMLRKYTSDLVLRSGIVISIGKADLSREEAFALLAAWSAPELIE